MSSMNPQLKARWVQGASCGAVMTTCLEIPLPSHGATLELGEHLAQSIEKNLVVALTGNLGAGKTTLVQGLGKGLGVRDFVSSPTFTMLNEYDDGRVPLFHLDMYRLSEAGMGAQQDLHLLELELAEISSSPGVVVIEWADLFAAALAGKDHLAVDLQYAPAPDDPTGDLQMRVAMVRTSGEVPEVVVKRISQFYL